MDGMPRCPALRRSSSAMRFDASSIAAEPLLARCADAARWRYHLVMLAAAWMIVGAIFTPDIGAMVASWSRTGAFNHCFLIGPIIAWIVWRRRSELARMAPEFSALGVMVTLVAGLLWAAGEAGHVALLRQAAAVIAAQGAVVALLGRPVSRALLFPLLFAVFLIPVGSEVEPLLQHWTAGAAVALLALAGTPASLQGVVIDTPAGVFRVAEACSGVGFLLAMAAFAALVCLLCFRTPRRRALFFATAIAAALAANVLRAFLIMQAANRFGIDHPFVADHLLYGWLLFAIVLVVLYAASFRWFERDSGEPDIDAARLQGVTTRRRPWPYVAGILLVLLLPRLWLTLTEPADMAASPPPVEPVVPGWARTSVAAVPGWQPRFAGATWIGQWRYARSGEFQADLVVVVFDRQVEGKEIVGYGQGAVGIEGESGWVASGTGPKPDHGRGEWLRSVSGRTRYAATFYLIDGWVTGSRATAKLASIAARLLPGRDDSAVAVIVSADGDTPDQAALSVARFLRAAGSAEEIADRARAIR